MVQKHYMLTNLVVGSVGNIILFLGYIINNHAAKKMLPNDFKYYTYGRYAINILEILAGVVSNKSLIGVVDTALNISSLYASQNINDNNLNDEHQYPLGNDNHLILNHN